MASKSLLPIAASNFSKNSFSDLPLLFELIMTETNLALEDLAIIDLDVPSLNALSTLLTNQKLSRTNQKYLKLK